jgi:hypothetical protein
MNKLDELITTIMLTSERKCCKRKENKLWTPELQQSNLTIQYWNVMNKSLRQGITAIHRLQQIFEKMNPKTQAVIRDNTKTPSAALRRAIRDHRHIMQNNAQQREDYLNKLLSEINERDSNSQTSLKSLIYREVNRTDFFYIQTVYKGKRGKGISRIEVPKPNSPTEWISVTEPDQVTNHILDRNVIHFGQAKDTPFAKGNLQEVYGYKGTNDNAEKLIKEKILPQRLNEETIYTTKLLEQLADGNKLEDLPHDITFEEFCLAMQRWNERTTTSPSGRHLGHYKILLRLPVYTEENPTINISKQILHVYYTMTTMPRVALIEYSVIWL